jgi:hypothetical protein
MSTHPAGTASLTASLTGCVTLLWDVATLVGWSGGGAGLSGVLDRAFAAANIVGFLLGLVSRRSSGQGAAGLHLSWVPITVVLLFLAAYRPQTAATLLRSLAGLALDVFAGLADLVTTLWT